MQAIKVNAVEEIKSDRDSRPPCTTVNQPRETSTSVQFLSFFLFWLDARSSLNAIPSRATDVNRKRRLVLSLLPRCRKLATKNSSLPRRQKNTEKLDQLTLETIKP